MITGDRELKGLLADLLFSQELVARHQNTLHRSFRRGIHESVTENKDQVVYAHSPTL